MFGGLGMVRVACPSGACPVRFPADVTVDRFRPAGQGALPDRSHPHPMSVETQDCPGIG